jgi:hypothetical protein
MRHVVLVLTVLFACGGLLAPARADGPAPQHESGVPGKQPAAEDSKLDLQKPEDDAPKAAESWWQKVLRAAPNCKSFTDGCRTCSLTVCSNIGIACQPKDWSCNDPDANPKPEAVPDEKSHSKQ